MTCDCTIYKNVLLSVILTSMSLFAVSIYTWSLNENSIEMFEYINAFNLYLPEFLEEYPEYNLTILPGVSSPVSFYLYGWVVLALGLALDITVPIVLKFSNLLKHPSHTPRIVCYVLLVACFLVIDIWAAIYSYSSSAIDNADIPRVYNQYLSARYVNLFFATQTLAPPLVISLINIIWLYMLLMGTYMFYPFGIFGFIHDKIHGIDRTENQAETTSV